MRFRRPKIERETRLTIVEKGTLHTVRASSAPREVLASALFVRLDAACLAAVGLSLLIAVGLSLLIAAGLSFLIAAGLSLPITAGRCARTVWCGCDGFASRWTAAIAPIEVSAPLIKHSLWSRSTHHSTATCPSGEFVNALQAAGFKSSKESLAWILRKVTATVIAACERRSLPTAPPPS